MVEQEITGETSNKNLQARKELGLQHSQGTCHSHPDSLYSVMPLTLQRIGKQCLVQDKICTNVHHYHINSVCRSEWRRKRNSRQNSMLRVGQCFQSPRHHRAL